MQVSKVVGAGLGDILCFTWPTGHLAILKLGVEAWNKWRSKNVVIPAFMEADLRDAELEAVSSKCLGYQLRP